MPGPPVRHRSRCRCRPPLSAAAGAPRAARRAPDTRRASATRPGGATLPGDETGIRPGGPIRLLTHLRTFGFCFNPVSFYYCFDAADSRIETIVAEITNTPWKERHAYVLTDQLNEGKGTAKRYRFDKVFHVSPFIDMAIAYDWRFNTPGEMLSVHMEDHKDGAKLFDATLQLERREISAATLAHALFAFPLMTLKVIGAIHWQALRLWLKRVPLYTHPKKLPSPNQGGARAAKPR